MHKADILPLSLVKKWPSHTKVMKTKINYISNPPALPYHKSKTVNENVKKISTTISTQSCTGNKSDFIGPGLGWQ